MVTKRMLAMFQRSLNKGLENDYRNTNCFISSSVLFILALGGLSNQEKAKRAVWYGIIGMALAVLATVLGPGMAGWSLVLLIPLLGVGAFLGVAVAKRVEMTDMPQLVAALHSFVGLAAVFIGLNAEFELATVRQLIQSDSDLTDLTGFGKKLAAKDAVEIAILKVEVFLGVFIGAVTFTGSIVAFGKLAGKLDGKPFNYCFFDRISNYNTNWWSRHARSSFYVKLLLRMGSSSHWIYAW